ncbi:MAG TPA: CBS domain-containing protein [Candidatus Acidoferrales bacterium]|nr:CBS domain-containing protein [Candidatus Acidoferrales bacterium]
MGFQEVYDYVAGKADWAAYGLPLETEEESVLDRMDRRFPTCALRDAAVEAKRRAESMGLNLCPVLNENGILLGVVPAAARQADASGTAEDVLDPGPTTLRPSVSVKSATQYLHKSGLDAIPITSSDGKLLGIFRRGAPAERTGARSR